MNNKQFAETLKVRSSALGQVMGELKNQITEAQLKKIDELEAKDKLTVKQQETLNELITKRDRKPTWEDLPETAKTYIKRLFKEFLYGRRLGFFTNKYVKNGIAQEDKNIDVLNEYLGENFTNNKKQFTNDYITGEPDIIKRENIQIRDVKSSWDADTFPLFERKLPKDDYYWQVIGYMDLKKSKVDGYVDYILNDTNEEIILKEFQFNNPKGIEDYEEFKKDYIYKDIDLSLRIKSYRIPYSKSEIQKIHDRVKLLREYAKELITRI